MKVGVIGAGTMGQGIAKAFAQLRATRALCDIKQSGPRTSRIRSQGSEQAVAKGKMTQGRLTLSYGAITLA